MNNSWVTVGNFLLDGQNCLKNYVGNEDISLQIKQESFCQLLKHEFPIYGHQIKNRISKAVARRKLFDKAAVLLSSNLPKFSPTSLIIKDVLDCMCNIPELLTFCSD